MASTESLIEQAASLATFVAGGVNNTHDVGNQTSTIYDTAWVSMVRKPSNIGSGLLFPECFQFVLDRQLPSGVGRVMMQQSTESSTLSAGSWH